MPRLLRRLWSWIRERLLGKSPPVEAVVAATKPQLSNLDYEGCLFALIAEVEAGGSWANLQVILILRRMSAAQLADWLSAFSDRWLAEKEAYQVLAGQLRQLGAIAVSPLGAVAMKVGQQLQVEKHGVSEDAVPLDLEEDAEFQKIVEQMKAAVDEPNIEKALEIADRCVLPYPKKAMAWSLRGLLLKELCRYELAIESYDQAIALEPNHAGDWNSRGFCLHNLGCHELAIESYDQAISLEPNYALALHNRSFLLNKLGRYELAIENLNQAIMLDPNNAIARHNRGVSLDKLGCYELAIESYDQAIAIEPDRDNAWHNRGISLHLLGRNELAIESYDQTITLNPNNAIPWINRGVSLSSLGRDELAIESYDQAIILEPDNAGAWYNRGSSLDRLGRCELAIESCDQAITLEPGNANTWHNRGIALGHLGRCELAIESCDQAITLEPDNAGTWHDRGFAAHHLENKAVLSSLQSRFVLSLTQSKQQLLRSWQPPNRDTLTQSLEQSMATSAQHLKESFPQIADTFSSSLSPVLQKFLQRPYDLESVHAVLRQPIPETLTQWLEQNEQNHPHYANPDLNQRGYRGALASYRAPLNKAIRKDTHPEGWAELHQAIGKAHLRESKLRSSPRGLWQQAANSFSTALSAPDLATQSPAFYLKLLESLIDLSDRLGEPQTAEELQRQGRDLITKLLHDDNLSATQKQSFALTASRFEQLSVDSLVQQNELNEALVTAETGKKLCLRWLLQLEEIPPVDLAQLQLNPNQAILYWHLSLSRLTTFCLLPGDTSPRLIPPVSPTNSDPANERPDWLQQQLAWEDWLQQWNHDYSDHSRLNKGTSKESHPWRQGMTGRLNQLSDLLNIDAIEAELSKANVSELLLVPHRDLHRFPLHGFFADYTCRYLPHLSLQSATHSTEPLPLAPLLIVENPKHEVSTNAKSSKGLAELPFAELEAECLRQLVAPQTYYTLAEGNATKAQLHSALADDYRLLHFSGHGIYNASVPAQSCLFLSGADQFTLIDIVKQDLRQLQLVTLAACETAITGNESITDEYIGLVSAFLSAGARYVLSTLWRVESEASMVLIVEFYRNLSQQMPPAEALRQAQSFLANADRQTLKDWFTNALALVSDPVMQVLLRERQEFFAQSGAEQPFSHPYFWSPFTLTSL